MTRKFQSGLLAAALLLPASAALVALPAAAQTRPAARIVSMAIHAEEGLAPGSTLTFTVQGTPRADAVSVAVGDRVVVPLRPISAGNYSGTFTVRRGDRIDPMGVATVRLVANGVTATRAFNYPPSIRATAMGAAPAPVRGPLVERFSLRHDGVLEPGEDVRFRLRGAPDADVQVSVPGVISGLDLREVRPGVYEGSYTLRRRDDPNAFSDAVATVTAGNRRVQAHVDREHVRDDNRGDDWRRDSYGAYNR